MNPLTPVTSSRMPQFTAELRNPLARGIAFFRRQLGEVFTDVRIAELARRPHLLVHIKEELSARLHFAIKSLYRSARIRRVVKHPIRNDELESFVLERSVHEIGLNDR